MAQVVERNCVHYCTPLPPPAWFLPPAKAASGSPEALAAPLLFELRGGLLRLLLPLLLQCRRLTRVGRSGLLFLGPAARLLRRRVGLLLPHDLGGVVRGLDRGVPP